MPESEEQMRETQAGREGERSPEKEESVRTLENALDQLNEQMERMSAQEISSEQGESIEFGDALPQQELPKADHLDIAMTQEISRSLLKHFAEEALEDIGLDKETRRISERLHQLLGETETVDAEASTEEMEIQEYDLDLHALKEELTEGVNQEAIASEMNVAEQPVTPEFMGYDPNAPENFFEREAAAGRMIVEALYNRDADLQERVAKGELTYDQALFAVAPKWNELSPDEQKQFINQELPDFQRQLRLAQFEVHARHQESLEESERLRAIEEAEERYQELRKDAPLSSEHQKLLLEYNDGITDPDVRIRSREQATQIRNWYEDMQDTTDEDTSFEEWLSRPETKKRIQTYLKAQRRAESTRHITRSSAGISRKDLGL